MGWSEDSIKEINVKPKENIQNTYLTKALNPKNINNSY